MAVFAGLSLFAGIALSTIIFRALALLGIGVISYIGIDSLLDNVYDIVDHEFDALDSEIADLMGLLNFDVAISLILSAYSIRLSIVLVKRIGLRQ